MTNTAIGPLPGARAGRDPARAIKRGPRSMTPEAVAATQRERLFDALVHTVAEKGYANARVSDICTAAGVTRPAFYALFAGKEDAFLDTYRHGTGVVLRLMDDAYANAGDWHDGARAALKVLLDVLASVPAFAAMAIVEIDAAGPLARRERTELLGRFARFFAEAPGVPDGLVGAIVGGVYAAIYGHVSTGRVAELPDLLPMLSYFMMAPFLGRDGAAAELACQPAGERVVAPCATSDTDEVFH
ncbi:TetR family transcriptional regulator [Actinoplanes sp. SE50]|uniref:TetR/AcrR family transcriptional regulator n=1 Tax=unclassified Actinoplanes TaxID=2626549 RepID=UPI00023ECF18|nr:MULTISPECIES: TetR/AcrR family transcriptional regulator [unclassified Actinoplanes]AEV86610.1 HTH-type transcriptional repressor Bm3R1 [Actinoplanes sp. SE50/110]ATO85008.1 TetR family transcriptional regulator [Actinoplanes sp. SE50]SLM02417.1 TetR family transcriptional regulator [Actinoplanes sp. SE50/110]